MTAGKVKIFTLAEVPPDKANAWLQHLRDFDAANPGCHFQVFADVPDGMTIADIRKMLQVSPPMKFEDVFKRKEP